MTTTRVSILVAVLFLAGCAAQPSSPPTGDACVAVAQFQASVEAFRSLEPSAENLDELATAGLAVQRAFRDLREAVFELADARVTELNQAVDDLKAALDDLPDGTSPSDAVASIEDERAAVSAALEALANELDCPS
jgi:predicted RNA-binding Zn ribbon-like protein